MEAANHHLFCLEWFQGQCIASVFFILQITELFKWVTIIFEKK